MQRPLIISRAEANWPVYRAINNRRDLIDLLNYNSLYRGDSRYKKKKNKQ